MRTSSARIRAGVALLLLATPAAAQQNARGIRTADLHQLRSVEDVQLSPDGRLIAYVVSNRERPGRPYSQIWIATAASGEARRLGAPTETGSGPRWSPDGQWLAYFGSDGNRSGIVIRKPDGTGTKFVAETQGSNHPVPGTGERLSWAPDNQRIAFVSATPGPEPNEAGPAGDPIVITRYLYRTTGADGSSYFSDNRRLHVFVADVGGGAVKQLTDGTYNEHSIHWSPTGDEILFVSNREPDADRFFNHDIYAVRVSDSRIRALTSNEAVVYRPRWSPDGRMVAYQGTRRGLTSSETTMEDTRTWVMNADGSGQRELAASIDNRHGTPDWSHDGRFVYFTVQERGNVFLYRVALAAGSKAELVIKERGRVGEWSLGPRNEISYAFHSPADMPQLYHSTAQGARRLTDLNRELLNTRAVADVEAFTFVAFDGLEVEAFLTMPHGRGEGTKHPLIVMIKGGPHGQQGPTFDPRAQAFATEGYASLMVNYRGSTGYGQKFTDAIFADQNGREAMDVLQGTDAAARRYPWLDRNRMGVEGGSYGGQLSMWLVTQTDRFAAAIPRAGIANLVSHNYLSYYHDYLAVEFGGFPHQNGIMDKLWERSPIRYVAQVRTPVMLVHGLNDHNVPRTESEQFYIALKDVGVETELVLYPRAGHGLAETKQIVDFADRSIAWYRKHFEKRGVRVSDGGR
jgi:dipeptidyl aminopeptidase/acylaminoacyl peptidase